MRKNETTKFEFLITIEGNIVCQRFFSVKDYNPAVRRALDLYYAFREIAEDIQKNLRQKSIEFLFENEKYFFGSVDQLSPPSTEQFIMSVRLGNEVIIERQFPANIYPPKVRYTVDVRPEIRDILTKISDTMSQEEYEMDFNGVEL